VSTSHCCLDDRTHSAIHTPGAAQPLRLQAARPGGAAAAAAQPGRQPAQNYTAAQPAENRPQNTAKNTAAGRV